MTHSGPQAHTQSLGPFRPFPILPILIALPITPQVLVLPRSMSGASPLAAISIAPDLVLRLMPTLEDDVATVSSSWLKG